MLHGSLNNSLDPVNPQCMVFAKSGGSSKLLGDATGMLVALRFPRPPWLIPPSHFLYFPFINLVGDINCRNLTYISCLHGKLSFHIKCTQRQDELVSTSSPFPIYNLLPKKQVWCRFYGVPLNSTVKSGLIWSHPLLAVISIIRHHKLSRRYNLYTDSV